MNKMLFFNKLQLKLSQSNTKKETELKTFQTRKEKLKKQHVEDFKKGLKINKEQRTKTDILPEFSETKIIKEENCKIIENFNSFEFQNQQNYRNELFEIEKLLNSDNFEVLCEKLTNLRTEVYDLVGKNKRFIDENQYLIKEVNEQIENIQQQNYKENYRPKIIKNNTQEKTEINDNNNDSRIHDYLMDKKDKYKNYNDDNKELDDNHSDENHDSLPEVSLNDIFKEFQILQNYDSDKKSEKEDQNYKPYIFNQEKQILKNNSFRDFEEIKNLASQITNEKKYDRNDSYNSIKSDLNDSPFDISKPENENIKFPFNKNEKKKDIENFNDSVKNILTKFDQIEDEFSINKVIFNKIENSGDAFPQEDEEFSEYMAPNNDSEYDLMNDML